MSVRRTAALALAAVLLAGCQDEPEPEFDPTSSESASESESSEDPEAQTAEEFIEEWFRLAVDFQNTGDSVALAAVSPGCRPCNDLIASVEAIYRAGGHVRIEEMDVTSVRPIGKGEYAATVEASKTRVRESSDAPTQTIPGNTNDYRIFLTRADDAWNMANYQDTPS
jgi:hypothetical protein